MSDLDYIKAVSARDFKSGCFRAANKVLGKEDVTQIIHYLAENAATVKTLILINNQLAFNDLRQIILLAAKCPNIEMLVIDENDLGNEGAELIAYAFAGNQTLQTISLEGNGIGARGGIALGRMIASCLSLIWVRLSNNKLGNEGVIQIFKMLPDRNAAGIAGIYLTNNQLSSYVLPFIANVLDRGFCLVGLCLSHNAFSSIGLSAFKAVFQGKTELDRLGLAHCGITSSGMRVIAQAKNQSIGCFDELDISGNPLGREGVFHMIEMVRTNKSPRRLLANLEIDKDMVPLLIAALENNITSAEMYMDDIPLRAQDEEKLNKIKTQKNITYYDLLNKECGKGYLNEYFEE